MPKASVLVKYSGQLEKRSSCAGQRRMASA